MPSCPTCKSDEQCAMTTQTCKKCPVTYCVKISDLGGSDTTSGWSKSQITAISAVLAVAGFLAIVMGGYMLWRRRQRLNKAGSSELGPALATFDTDTFTDQATEMDTFQDNRSHTKAPTNVINVAYIPGVTARLQPPNKRHSAQASAFSKDTFFSDLENASFHGGKVATKASQPALVTIDDYDYDDDHDEDMHPQNPFKLRVQRQQGSFSPISEEFSQDIHDDLQPATRTHNLTRYGSLRNKIQPPLSSSSESEGDSDSDSDEEHIELITRKHREGTLDADSVNVASSKGSTLKTTTTTIT